MLGGANSFSMLNVAAGTLIFGAGATIPTTPFALLFGGQNTASVNFAANAATLSSITIPYNNAVAISTSTMTFNGAVKRQGNVAYNMNNGAFPVNIVGTGSMDMGSSNRTFDVTYNINSQDLAVNLPLLGKTAGIVKTGTGNLGLNSAAGTFSGGVDVQNGAGAVAGRGSDRRPRAVTAGPAGTGVINLANNTSLRGNLATRIVNNNITTAGQFSLGSITVNSNIAVAASNRGISASGSGTINGTITGTASAAPVRQQRDRHDQLHVRPRLHVREPC